MFYNRKSKPRASKFLRPAFIHPVKAFKNSLLMLQRNADTGILYRKDNLRSLFLHFCCHPAIRFVIPDGVFNQIVGELLRKLLSDMDIRPVISLIHDINAVFRCPKREHFHTFFCNFCQIYHIKDIFCVSRIQLWELDNVIDQRKQSCCAFTDFPWKMPDLLFIYKSCFHQLRITWYRRKGCF